MIPIPSHHIFLVKETARLIIDVKNPLILINNPQKKVFSNPSVADAEKRNIV